MLLVLQLENVTYMDVIHLQTCVKYWFTKIIIRIIALDFINQVLEAALSS